MEPSPVRAPRAVLFDAYGTLFDVYSVGVIAERLFPGMGERLGVLWRDKQIEYTRLTSMSGQARSFRDCTRAGLRYAARRFELAVRREVAWRLAHPDRIRWLDVEHRRYHVDIDTPEDLERFAATTGHALRWPATSTAIA